MKKWYEELFKNYALAYDKECFTKGTLGECDFIEKEISYNKSIKILDVGCGTGRHSIELSRRGYKLIGVDLSSSMLDRAREKASELGLNIDFKKMDARKLSFNGEFDLAIMLCEGAFPLMETDDMNFEILKSVTRALKDNAKFIFTTLNGLFPIFNSTDEPPESIASESNASYKSKTFDLMTFRDHNITSFTDDDGNRIELSCNERYYIPSEITWLLKSLGYKKIDIHAAKLGAFSRAEVLSKDDFEMLVIAEK